ncbi:hypothetical protein Tco_1274502 [Tanacetum coccineum]
MKRRKGAGRSSSKKGEKRSEELLEQSWFNELVDTNKELEEHELQLGSSIMFGKCMKKFLNKDKINKADLEGPAFELLKNRFKNNIELKYNLEQCHLAWTYIIDWTNPEGERFHNDLSKPLPLTGPPGRKTILTRYFFNNDLEYLRLEMKRRTQTSTSTMEMLSWVFITGKTTANYSTKEALDTNHLMMFYSKLKIISVKRITVEKKYGYRYLKETVVKRADKKEYMFVEVNFLRLNQNDIENMYLLKIQDKIHHIDGVDEFDLINALQLYIRRIVISKRVEDAQLGVESYQKKLNLTKPHFMVGCIYQKVSYTTLSHLKGVVYKGLNNQKLLMRADELQKFSNKTLNKVYNKLEVMPRDNKKGFINEGMAERKWTSKDKERTTSILEKIKKTLKERRRFIRLECFVGGRRNKTDYMFLVRPE